MKVTLLKKRILCFSFCISFRGVVVLHRRLHWNVFLSENNMGISQIDDFLFKLWSRDSLLERSRIDVFIELIVVVCCHDNIWRFRKVMMMCTHFRFLCVSLMLEIFLNRLLGVHKVVWCLDCRAIWTWRREMNDKLTHIKAQFNNWNISLSLLPIWKWCVRRSRFVSSSSLALSAFLWYG